MQMYLCFYHVKPVNLIQDPEGNARREGIGSEPIEVVARPCSAIQQKNINRSSEYGKSFTKGNEPATSITLMHKNSYQLNPSEKVSFSIVSGDMDNHFKDSKGI